MNAKSKKSRFPKSLFFIYLVVLLFMCGIHTGFLIGMEHAGWPDGLKITIPLLYWGVVAAALTFFTRWRVRKTYDEPLIRFADAARQVAEGDFSVYVQPAHSIEKMDYLDQMIEDFNKMVEELGSIETLKVDFFSSVSHEFKTPLAVIHSNAEMLAKSRLPEEQQKEYVENILSATRRLSNLISNILKLNKLEKQAIHPMPQDFDLCAQICDCALQFEDKWEEKQIELEADLEDQAIITADPELLEMVWTNLISNAVKFTPEGGKITISERTEGKNVVVSVTDTGCGMSEETMRHIFDQFYQGDTSHATEGNGLGLALVHRILDLSGGTIEVTSHLGDGSTFTVRLPVRITQETE